MLLNSCNTAEGGVDLYPGVTVTRTCDMERASSHLLSVVFVVCSSATSNGCVVIEERAKGVSILS